MVVIVMSDVSRSHLLCLIPILSTPVVGQIESLQVDEVAESSLLDEADQVAAQVRLLQVFHLEHTISIVRLLKDLGHLDKEVLLHEL